MLCIIERGYPFIKPQEFTSGCWNFHFLSFALKIWYFMNDATLIFYSYFDFTTFKEPYFGLTLSSMVHISRNVLKSHWVCSEGITMICRQNSYCHLLMEFVTRTRFVRWWRWVCRCAPFFPIWLGQLFFDSLCWSNLSNVVFRDSCG